MYKNKQKEDNHINRISIKLNKNILHIESNPNKTGEDRSVQNKGDSRVYVPLLATVTPLIVTTDGWWALAGLAVGGTVGGCGGGMRGRDRM